MNSSAPSAAPVADRPAGEAVPRLALRGLGHAYEGRRVVDDVSAEVAPVVIWTSVVTSLINQLSGPIKYVFTFGPQSLRGTS